MVNFMLCVLFVLLCCVVFVVLACGILVPPPGIEPMPTAVEAWSLNHWTAREVPVMHV